jgi:Skp family chaperone for outer membrane proteins
MKKLLLLSILITALQLPAQNNFGYFNYEKVEQANPYYERITDFQCALEQYLNDSISILQEQLGKKYFSLCGDYIMSEKQREDTQAELDRLNARLSTCCAWAQAEYLRTEEALRSALKEKITESLALMCASKKIEFLAEEQAILYCDDCRDYTDEIINYVQTLCEIK